METLALNSNSHDYDDSNNKDKLYLWSCFHAHMQLTVLCNQEDIGRIRKIYYSRIGIIE